MSALHFDPSSQRRLLYLVTTDAYFLSHRLPIALAALKEGFDVWVACKDTGLRTKIERKGIKFIPLKALDRSGINPLKDFMGFWEIFHIYKHLKPTIVHHVAMKPVLYGSLAAWGTRIPKVINALTGLGYLFISKKWHIRFIRSCVEIVMRTLFCRPQSTLIVQNKDDYKHFQSFLPAERIVLIRGSGVDTTLFSPRLPLPHHSPLQGALVARMLWDKGIGIAIEAIQQLRQERVSVTLILVGEPDPKNPSCIDEKILRAWHSQGLCQWIGQQKDIASLYQRMDFAILPSFREGLPKSLLEAASCGLPIITSDVPGCREVVSEGENGFLVPLDALKLAEALRRFVEMPPSMRHHMGERSRQKALAFFSVDKIVQETLALYKP